MTMPFVGVEVLVTGSQRSALASGVFKPVKPPAYSTMPLGSKVWVSWLSTLSRQTELRLTAVGGLQITLMEVTFAAAIVPTP